MLRSGALTAVRPGVYVEGGQPDDAPDDTEAQHALLVRAEVAELDTSAVVSHVSAAVLHGLSVWGSALDVVQVTRDRRRSGSRRGSCVHVHCAPLSSDEIVVVDGMRCTSVARTVVDLARTTAFEHAVVSADAALCAGLGRSALGEALQRVRGWPGAPVARRVAAFADARSESVGESRSRVAIARAGLPVPRSSSRCGTAVARLGPTSRGWRSGPSGSSTARRSSSGCCSPACRPVRRSSPRRCARTGSARRAGKWCGGRGTTCATSGRPRRGSGSGSGR